MTINRLHSSRREFLRLAGVGAGGALAAGLVPTRADAWTPWRAATQPAASPTDALAARRAQMGALPIEQTPLGSNIFLLSGPGGNVVVLHGPDGKVVVDSFVQPAWPKLKATLDGVDRSPITLLIDTHWHFDHADNNASFKAAGAKILAHANTKNRLSETHDLLGMHFAPAPPEALPTQTFTTTLTQRVNGEELALGHFDPAHTDTDIYVRYPKANVLHLGDVFFNGRYPFIDASTGGNINGMITGATKALGMADAQTKIVPGHGPLGDKAALTKYRDLLTTVRDRVQKLKTAGRSLAEVQQAKPSAEFDGEWGKGMIDADTFVALVYNTLIS
jgi:cyclase